MVANELWSVARDKKSLPVVKISYFDRVSSLESKNIWLLRSYGRLLGTKSHFRLKISGGEGVMGRDVRGQKVTSGCEIDQGTKCHFP